MVKVSIKILISTSLLSVLAFAGGSDTKNCPQDGKAYKECKFARKNDQGAKKYLLTEAGQLLRITDDNGIKCTIDQDVVDFKVSQHPNDVAVLYYTKKSHSGEKLMIVNNVDGDFAGECLKVTKSVLMEDVKEFSVVSNQHTTIVNAALSKSGVFLAWDNKNVVYKDSGIYDYQMNQCFGASGKSFSSFGLFTLDQQGVVTKVKGSASGSYVKDSTDNGRYNKIKDFVSANSVCK